jgi:hypothetical protein
MEDGYLFEGDSDGEEYVKWGFFFLKTSEMMRKDVTVANCNREQDRSSYDLRIKIIFTSRLSLIRLIKYGFTRNDIRT